MPFLGIDSSLQLKQSRAWMALHQVLHHSVMTLAAHTAPAQTTVLSLHLKGKLHRLQAACWSFLYALFLALSPNISLFSLRFKTAVSLLKKYFL